MSKDKKLEIKAALESFIEGNLYENAIRFFETLGYSTERTHRLAEPTATCFLRSFPDAGRPFRSEKALINDWKFVDLLFQLTTSEIKKLLKDDAAQTEIEFGTKGMVGTNLAIIESYLFFTLYLTGDRYTRTQLSEITREINRLFPMPVMILFRYGETITLSIINRRIHKKDKDKDVLEKVTLIKDIRIRNPHRAHLEIFFDLSFGELNRKYRFTDFLQLHKAWQTTLDTKELNIRFYQKLFNWYLFALRNVKFPQIRPAADMINDDLHQSESLIRLLTRMLFVWFMKEKGLINPELFDEQKLKEILKNFRGENGEETIYYKAILQNLFFATLNKPVDKRKVIDKGFNPKEYGDPLVYRFDELFDEPEKLLTYFKNIPFLNGGLFDCLDQKKDADNQVEIRLDGFSTKKPKQVIFPDKLFFGEYREIDLSRDYDDKKKNKVTIYGLIDILNQYKFTIEENTPVEEEIALDPELLGKVFENLLASYNPETQSTARKQTGSFYTPREIVNYMVDESLIAYLKNHLDDDPRLRTLFSYEEDDTGNPFDPDETHILLKAIDQCKILDPACGSGAFPMGALQKMIHVLHKLDPENHKWFDMVVSNFPAYMQKEVRKRLEKENWNYVRKLGIIQQCLYGVDIQPIATQIAKLRFFISLLVDQHEQPGEPNRGFEPLPNLDFKIVTANTLISAPSNKAIDAYARDAVSQFEVATNNYFSATFEEKEKLRKKIEKLIGIIVDANKMVINQWINKIKQESNSATGAKLKKMKEQQESYQGDLDRWNTFPNLFKQESVAFFEPKYFFPQVKNGFDIVIGNPPYVRVDDIAKESKILYNLTFSTCSGKFDLYYLFFEKALSISSELGIINFITPNKFCAATSGEVLRLLMLSENCSIEILSTSKLNVFNEASNYPIITCIRKTPNSGSIVVREAKSIEELSLSSEAFYQYPLFMIRQIPSSIIPINVSQKRIDTVLSLLKSNNLLSEIISFSEGLRIPAKFELQTQIKNTFMIVKQFQIEKWSPIKEGSYILQEDLLSVINVNSDRYSKIINSKLLIAEDALEITATVDYNYYIPQGGIYFGTPHEKYKSKLLAILAIINSRLLSILYEVLFGGMHMGGGYLRYRTNFIEKLPISANFLDNSSLSIISEYILQYRMKDFNIDFFQNLLDSMVYELYFPSQIQSAGCGVIQHLGNLPELIEGDETANLATIERVYQEFSDTAHPVSIAMEKMREVEEVRTIEGLDKAGSR